MQPQSHHFFALPSGSSDFVSAQIRNEIRRFESVHPCIFTIYDLLDCIEDGLVKERIRDQVSNIEGMLALKFFLFRGLCKAILILVVYFHFMLFPLLFLSLTFI